MRLIYLHNYTIVYLNNLKIYLCHCNTQNDQMDSNVWCNHCKHELYALLTLERESFMRCTTGSYAAQTTIIGDGKLKKKHL